MEYTLLEYCMHKIYCMHNIYFFQNTVSIIYTSKILYAFIPHLDTKYGSLSDIPFNKIKTKYCYDNDNTRKE